MRCDTLLPCGDRISSAKLYRFCKSRHCQLDCEEEAGSSCLLGTTQKAANTLVRKHKQTNGSINQIPSTYRDALIAQQNIGLRQIIMGKMSQEWEKLQGLTISPAGSFLFVHHISGVLL